MILRRAAGAFLECPVADKAAVQETEVDAGSLALNSAQFVHRIR